MSVKSRKIKGKLKQLFVRSRDDLERREKSSFWRKVVLLEIPCENPEEHSTMRTAAMILGAVWSAHTHTQELHYKAKHAAICLRPSKRLLAAPVESFSVSRAAVEMWLQNCGAEFQTESSSTIFGWSFRRSSSWSRGMLPGERSVWTAASSSRPSLFYLIEASSDRRRLT